MGLLRSQVFPRLVLAVEALLTGNLAQVLAQLQQGLRTTEHTAFVEDSLLYQDLKSILAPL
jgi:hypothetical protein